MSNQQLSERYIQDSFHSYLKSSLTQAKAERLLDADVLSSAESDLMITGPALCLYFAALRCTTHPPSVPLPRRSNSKNPSEPPMELSYDNCPPAFVSFLHLWARTVPPIQSLAPEHQHDLARVICGLPPLSQCAPPSVGGVAADLRAVAIEISQRRSFQDRFAGDLQAALDSGTMPGSPAAKKASFVPPPVYDPSPSPSSSTRASLQLPSSPGPSSSSSSNSNSNSNSGSGSGSGFPQRTPSPTPTLLPAHSPAIEFIRETLYAALGDALEQHPSLRTLLKRDPPRAYYAAVAFAVLDVATSAVSVSVSSSSGTSDDHDTRPSTGEVEVVGVLGTRLRLSECPPELRPFMLELAGIGRAAREMEEEDLEEAVRCAERGDGEGEGAPRHLTRMERVGRILEEGVKFAYAHGMEEGEGGGEGEGEGGRRRSVEGRAVAFANRVNALSLGVTRLRAFRERQEDVFRVLAGIGA